MINKSLIGKEIYFSGLWNGKSRGKIIGIEDNKLVIEGCYTNGKLVYMNEEWLNSKNTKVIDEEVRE